MDYARDLHSGEIVAAEGASSLRSYTCPRPGCGGRVFLRDGGNRRAHFAHHAGEGTPACDAYFPSGSGGDPVQRAIPHVEDAPSELGLVLAEAEARWGLGLRLPEIPREELGDTSLRTLCSAVVDVYAGRDRINRIGALDLRPGVGAARVDVTPTLQQFRTQPAGSWPSSITRERWLLECRGLEARGVLFRLRRGEWTRLVARSAVHVGETLLVLADARCTPPTVTEVHDQISHAGLQWCIWEVQLPSECEEKVTSWLARLGHELIPRPWSMDVASPPRGFAEGGEPIFWVGDAPVLTLRAPHRAVSASVVFQIGTNEHSASVTASQVGVAHVGVKVHEVGAARLTVAGDRSARLEIDFREHPLCAEVLAQLAQAPRLRVQIGTQTLEAWNGTEHSVRLSPRKQAEVRVELGVEAARARVTVWVHGKRRTRRGLDAHGVERAIVETLPTASRIEVEVDNLGRVVVVPTRAAIEAPREGRSADRLIWHDEIASMLSQQQPDTVPTLVEQPRGRAFVVRPLGAATLVRSRLALRRRLETGGSRS